MDTTQRETARLTWARAATETKAAGYTPHTEYAESCAWSAYVLTWTPEDVAYTYQYDNTSFAERY